MTDEIDTTSTTLDTDTTTTDETDEQVVSSTDEEKVVEQVKEESDEEVASELEEEIERKRIARFAHEAREARRHARDLESELARLKGEKTGEVTDDEVERKAERLAEQKAVQTEFKRKANEIWEEGVKEFGEKDFNKAVTSIIGYTGEAAINPVIVEALHDVGDGAKLLKYFADNPDIYEDLCKLPYHRMGIKLAKLATTVNKPKAVSKAPAPIRPVTSSGTAKDKDPYKDMSMDEYMKWEAKRFSKKGYVS